MDRSVVSAAVGYVVGVLTVIALWVISGRGDDAKLKTLLAERDGYRNAAVIASGFAQTQIERADSAARVADSLRARRLSRPKTSTTLPSLPPVCDTCVLKLTQVAYERDLAIEEAEHWREAWQTLDLAADSLKSALASSQKADSVGSEAVDVAVNSAVKVNLLAKITPKPGFGGFAGGCVTPAGGVQPCVGVGLTFGWRF